MVYTLSARPEVEGDPDGRWVASVSEFPELEAFGDDGAAARAALMKLVTARAATLAGIEAGRSSASERAFAVREANRNATGNLDKANPKPAKVRVEPPTNQRAAGEAKRLEWHDPSDRGPVAPTSEGASESNWRAGGWNRGGVLPR